MYELISVYDHIIDPPEAWTGRVQSKFELIR